MFSVGLNKVLVHFRLLSLVRGALLSNEQSEAMDAFFLRLSLACASALYEENSSESQVLLRFFCGLFLS